MQAGDRPRFQPEPLAGVRGKVRAGQEHFQSHEPVEFLLARDIDYPHPTAAQLAEQLVRTHPRRHLPGCLATGG